MSLSKFHIETLSFIINQHQDFAILLKQIPYLEINDVDHTGVGCFYNYKLSSDYHTLNINLNIDNESILGMGCQLEAENLIHGASLTLWINNKTIETLEILAHVEDFPIVELTEYSLKIVPVNIIDDVQTC